MKKISALAVIALGAAFGANAQESVAPKAGDFSVEIQVNPFSDNFETFRMPSLQGRYFIGDKDAIRFGIGFGVESHKDNGSVDNSNVWSKYRQGNFSINLGYERHFFNYKRVDLFAGVGLAYELWNAKMTTSESINDAIVETVYSNYNDRDYKSSNEFAAKVYSGIDFYVYKGLYLGAELGIKVGFQNFPEASMKVNDGEKVKTSPSSTGFLLKTYAEPALRLGWLF
ncbi:MAG: hypothetical protein HDS26_04665 [Bacteroides sp.]|nr:hypothetical protein [Bacteroides sp.]MBD5306838.1 hypothetical protein [Bacteroides sp.]